MITRLHAWARRRGITRVGFELFLLIQLAHLGEHVVQMVQLTLLGWPSSDARGLISRFDVEKVHFLWNLVVLVALAWLLGRGVRSSWLMVTTIWAVLHTSEHAYLLARALTSGLDGQPGVLGAGGWLARTGWTLAGLTTWSRPAVHFAWNLGEVALLFLTYAVFVGARLDAARRLAPAALVMLVAPMANPDRASVQHDPTRFVNATDGTCGGHSPCHATMQAAIDAASAGETIIVQAGTYTEQLRVRGKNATARASELDRIVIEADPAAPPGSVVLTRARAECEDGQAIIVQRSKFVTVRGLTITKAGGPAIHLLGGHNQNHAIHLERLRIFRNGGPACDGGITIGRGNVDTLIVHSLIYGNSRHGIAITGAEGGPHYIVNNTIHANAWSGVSITRNHEVFLVNNAITGNGTAPGRTDGRFGIEGEPSTAHHAGIHLLHNLVCGNRLGEIEASALGGGDSGNVTPTGTEGPGVTASPGCEVATRIYADPAGADGLLDTGDEDFTPGIGSPAIDGGMDPRTLGLRATFNPLFEADYLGDAVRPRSGTGSGPSLFDIAALEFAPPDAQAPAVTFLQPLVTGFVRRTIGVQAQATDDVAVTALALTVDGQPLSAALGPAPPAPSVTATAALATITLVDGVHTLTATAKDQAGKGGTASRIIVVDNSPPDSEITGDELEGTGVTFRFTGTDGLTAPANLLFAWRIDDGPFTAFSPATSATFTNLMEGTHTFEVKARDLAGNEDPTPAGRRVTIALRPVISSVDPPGGSVGALVTIAGARFTPGPTAVAFNGLAAIVRTLTETTITTTVPFGATTGSLTVTTPTGTGGTLFTVTRTSDFTLGVLPTQVTTLQGGSVSYAIAPAAVNGFSGLVSVSLAGLPPDISASFTPSTLGPGQTGTLTVQTSRTTPLGVHSVVVAGTAIIDGIAVDHQQTAALKVLAGDVTALAGRVLDTDADPVQGATFTIAGKSAQSDAGGNVLLVDLPAGPDQFLFIDGSTAVPDRKFPTFPALVTLQAGTVNVLPFTPHLHAQKAFNFTAIIPGQETVVTDPEIPGFEMRIPADVTIVGWDGQLNTKVSVRTVPLDRMPLPHPDPPIAARSVYMFYFDKVGGGTPSRPVPVTVLNDLGLEPGQQAELWYYDEGPAPGSASQRWQKAGTATVSPDGTTITTDPGVGLPRFCCGAFCFASVVGQGSGQSLKRGGARGGEPVDLATGLFVLEKTDFLIPGRLPLALTRTYRNADSTLGPFGVGSSALFTESLRQPTPQTMILIEPGNVRTTFALQSEGTYANDTEPSLRGTRLIPKSDGTVTLRFRDGTTHLFEPVGGGGFQLRSVADRNGNTLSIARDGFGRPTSLIESGGRRLELTFNTPFLQVVSARDPLGREVRYTYDSGFRLSSVTDAAGGVTRYSYDTAGNLLTITDPRGIRSLANQYSPSGRVVAQTQADGGVWTLAYMVAGARVTGPGCPGPSCPEIESREALERGYAFTGGFVVAATVTDPRGNATTYRFNSFGEVIERIDALGQPTKLERAEGTNLLLSTTDPLGRRTRYEYDPAGNIVTITDAAGHTRSFTYEPTFNHMTSMTDELGQTTQFAYDVAGNLVAVVDPLNARTTLSYDAAGQLTAVTDAASNTRTFSYDAFGSRVLVSNPLGQTTRRDFDVAGRMIARVDPLGSRTSFGYDPLNRVVGIADAMGGLTRMTYDPNGNLLTIVDPRGNTTTHVYDALDRLITRADPSGQSETFAYDRQSNLVMLTDRNANTSRYAYDPLDRRVAATYADGSSLQLRYDTGSRLVSVTDSLAGTIDRRYDAMDQLLTETTSHGVVLYGYDVSGRPVETALPGQTPVTYHWDVGSRLVAVAHGLHTVAFDYDAAGRRTRLTLPNRLSVQYEYDAASRVIGLVYRSPHAVLGDLAFEYDPDGKRISDRGSFARTLLGDPIAHAGYGPANRQERFGDAVMTYDNNGNVTSVTDTGGTTAFTWDARNRLVAIDSPESTHTFVYDAFGRRIRRISDGAVIDYVHDRHDVVQELRDTGVVTYLRGPWPDEPFTRSSGEFYLLGASGSVIALTDERGDLLTSYTYEVFGQARVDGSPTTNPLGYAAREEDATGLYASFARYYSPRLRRFISEDPIGFAGGDPNLYAYVYNNPVSLTDPSGLDATIWRPVGPGRTWRDGARNGNWGGVNWSGGQGPPFKGSMLPPVDSGDECYMRHDLCWDDCARCPATQASCKKVPCNRDLVRCLQNLSDDPRQWPRPPRPGTEQDSRFFRRMAIEVFRTPRDDAFHQIHPLLP